MPSSNPTKENKPIHRLSISLSAEQHQELTEIANENRVSIAWVVREAIDRLLKDQAPLLYMGKE